jgi:uncharacterized membrane protein
MKTGLVERSVEIAAPLELVYDAFSRFEDLPQFVAGVEDVHLADETHLRLRFGATVDVAAEITEARPFERIAWDAAISGSVSFEPVDVARTRVTVRLESDGHDGRLRGDLDRFKAVTEARCRAG